MKNQFILFLAVAFNALGVLSALLFSNNVWQLAFFCLLLAISVYFIYLSLKLEKVAKTLEEAQEAIKSFEKIDEVKEVIKVMETIKAIEELKIKVNVNNK